MEMLSQAEFSSERKFNFASETLDISAVSSSDPAKLLFFPTQLSQFSAQLVFSIRLISRQSLCIRSQLRLLQIIDQVSSLSAHKYGQNALFIWSETSLTSCSISLISKFSKLNRHACNSFLSSLFPELSQICRKKIRIQINLLRIKLLCFCLNQKRRWSQPVQRERTTDSAERVEEIRAGLELGMHAYRGSF